jgi:hypothetical protein
MSLNVVFGTGAAPKFGRVRISAAVFVIPIVAEKVEIVKGP